MASPSSSMWFDHTTTQQEANQAQPTSFIPETTNYEYMLIPPEILLDERRYICELCHKGFPRKQNLSLHQKTHNIKPTLKTSSINHPMPKRFLCPEPTCRHHNLSHFLRDFSSLRKHYERKHLNDKKYRCGMCSKAYSVECDLKDHSKKCHGNKYVCIHCNARFLRKGDLIFHQTNCDGVEHLGEESYPQTVNLEDMEGNTIMQFGTEHRSTMTNPSIGSNMTEIPPPFFPPTSTHQNPQEYHFDMSFYENILREENPLNTINFENTNLMGNGMGIYGAGEGSYPSLDGYSVFNVSDSLNVNPAMPNPNLTIMLNTTTSSSNWGGYEQQCYRNESAQLDITSDTNAFNLVTLEANPATPNPSLTGTLHTATTSSNLGGYAQGGYGYGSGQLDFTSNTSAVNLGKSAKIGGSAPLYDHNMQP